MRALDSLIEQRTSHRRAKARQLSDRILAAAVDQGVEIILIGSLARTDFQVHSDIDLLVRGAITPSRRAMVERLVAHHMRGTDMPYDLIYEADMTPDRLQELLHDVG